MTDLAPAREHAAPGAIDREKLVGRHQVNLNGVDGANALTVGNGDFAVTVDATGLQSFVELHDPSSAMSEDRLTLNTGTLSSWCWHEMPNPNGYELSDAMTEYNTSRGVVRYPDKFDLQTIMGKEPTEEFKAGTWLHVNPQRVDLGRFGFVRLLHGGGFRDVLPTEITHARQSLDMWQGRIDTEFRFEGHRVRVTTVADPQASGYSVGIQSDALGDVLGLRLRFGYASDSFGGTVDWASDDRHTTRLECGNGELSIHRRLDETVYVTRVAHSPGVTTTQFSAHEIVLTPSADTSALEASIAFSQDGAIAPAGDVPAAFSAAAEWWAAFWQGGAAADFSGTSDPRASELERRIVLSQYLTAVNCSGSVPPQETGLITNSWQGKMHLEMHWWHAAHFATWGRPELLRKSLDWYASIEDAARRTAREQHYRGVRWPKQVGPDGRESPTDIGALLIWQQPHLIYLLELLRRAGQHDVVAEFGHLVSETAEFMASFAEERDGIWHLPAPLMPAQEFYDARTTEDPTFELAYWWHGLELAQQWREHAGEERSALWTSIQRSLAHPDIRDGVYSAIATPPYLRRDDHPSMLAAFGMVPPTPLIDPAVMADTLASVLGDWEWDSAWGWDFPVAAMTATRLGDPARAVDALLADRAKNHYSVVGHIRQMGNTIPVYLPGNGGLLAAVSLMIAGTDTGVPELGGFPDDWTIAHEGFIRWP